MEEQFLNKIVNNILQDDLYIKEIISKALGMPKVPSGTKMPKMTVYWQGEGKRRPIQINVGSKIPDGYGPNPKQKIGQESVSEKEGKKEEKISTKEKIKISPEEKKKLKDQISGLKEKVLDKIKEKIKPEKKEISPQKTFEREFEREKGIGESEAFYNLRLGTAALDYINDFYKKFENIPVSDPKYQKQKEIVNNMIDQIHEQLTKKVSGKSAKLLETKRLTESANYQQSKDRLNNLEQKMSQGEKLNPEEAKEYNKLSKQIEMSDKIYLENQRKQLDIENSKKQEEITKDLEVKWNKGEKFYKDYSGIKTDKIKTTSEIKEKDATLFSILRYGKNIPLKEIKKNNKNTVNSFIKEKLKDFEIKNVNTNYEQGTITFDSSQVDNPRKFSKKLKQSFLDDDSANNAYILRSTKDGKLIISVKQYKTDWVIRPMPENLSTAVNEQQKKYEQNKKTGAKTKYQFWLSKDKALSINPAQRDQPHTVVMQGGQRTGKGLTFGSEMSQALGWADGSVVQFFNFDHTAAFYSDLNRSDPKFLNKMQNKGLIGFNGVTKDNLKTLEPTEQANALEDYINNFSTAYNNEYNKRTVIRNLAKTNNLDQVKQQIPTAVFNMDEAEALEDLILTNSEIGKDKKDELLNKVAGVISNQQTNGVKVGMMLKMGLQQGFKSDIMQRVMRTSGNTLISYDGNADPITFNVTRTRGMTDALRSVKSTEVDEDGNPISTGRVIVTRTGQGGGSVYSPILPGTGSVEAVTKANK